MNRIDRLNAILIHLQSKTRVTLSELEETYQVGRRTVFRDIKSLMEAGVPIGGDAGQGYFIVAGYHLPPVVFNKEEASAILMGAKFIAHQADPKTEEAFSSALTKVKAVLRYSDREYLEKLDERMAIRPTPYPVEKKDSHLAEIQRAIATNRLLSMNYYVHYRDDHTARAVEPLGLVFYSGQWHLIAYCRLRKALRDFRVDRIQNAATLPEEFDPSNHVNYLDFLNDSLLGTDAKEAIVHTSALASRSMGEQKYFMGLASETKLPDGAYEMKFITPHYDYLAQWLMTFGTDIIIVSPSELLGLAASFAKKMLDHYAALFSAK